MNRLLITVSIIDEDYNAIGDTEMFSAPVKIDVMNIIWQRDVNLSFGFALRRLIVSDLLYKDFYA